MAQNFRVNESRNTMWIGIALLTAAAVVILALAAQDFPGTSDRTRTAESVTTAGTVPVLTEAGMPFPTFETSPAPAATPETQVNAEQWMPHPPFAVTESAASATELPRVTYRDRIVPDDSLVPDITRAPVAEIPQASYEASLVAEHVWLAELRGGSTTERSQPSFADFREGEGAITPEAGVGSLAGATGATYMDRIVPDDSLVPSLGRAPVAEEYTEMPWRTPNTVSAQQNARTHQPQ